MWLHVFFSDAEQMKGGHRTCPEHSTAGLSHPFFGKGHNLYRGLVRKAHI
jgi:hypothetical protein